MTKNGSGMKDNIEALVKEYCEKELPRFVPRNDVIRNLPEPKRFNLVDIITGMRRSGKTFYLFQKIDQLTASGFPRKRILYFNFADDRLSPSGPDVMDEVLDSFWRQNPDAREEGAYLFLDEVQEADGWQGFCQRVAENEKVTMVITGSSSKLSSEEIATRFRGRSHSHEMSPLSFAEYCRFNGIPVEQTQQNVFSSKERTRFEGLFSRYLTEGGFPGVQGRVDEDRIELLQAYVRDVVARDVAERFGREDIRLANQFALYGLRNSACELSVNGLTDALKEQGFKIYWEKADRLVDLLMQAFLFFEVNDFVTTLKPQSTALPKVYAVDPGIAHAVSRANQQDIGKRFETAIYLELRRRMAGRRTESITSYTVPGQKNLKVDFLLGDSLDEQPYELIQATVEMDNPKTRKREVGSLVASMKATRLDRGTIVTMRSQEDIATDIGLIRVVPAWKWCLEQPDAA